MNPFKAAHFICHTSFFSLLGFLLGVCSAPLSEAKPTPQTEVHVTLLGQPCLLQGPFDELTLRTIHAVGPAQLYPNISPLELVNSEEQVRKALTKIRGNSSLPSPLDRYRDKLGKRLEAQISFLESLESEKKTHTPGLLLKTAKRYLQPQNFKSFESLSKKISTTKGPAQYRELIEQLFELYNDGIERDPEEDFHRAIKKMNVQYICSFEESQEATGD